MSSPPNGPSRPPFIETFTGRRFQPLNPVVADINIDDITHALSHQCRFSGHVKTFYSVAEHSVRVAWLVRDQGGTYAEQLWALLHDASEAYLVDLPTPLKSHPQIGAGYRAAEAVLMEKICERFELDPVMPGIVARADSTMLATEVRDLMFGRPEHWTSLVEPDREEICPWQPIDAQVEFRFRFELLTRQRRMSK